MAMNANRLFLKAFSYNVRARMRELKMTTRRLAFLCGITMRAMRRYLLDAVQPPLHIVFAIASALQCDVDDLIPKTPLSERPAKTPRRYVSKVGRVTRVATCRRSYFYRVEEERGFKLSPEEMIERATIASQISMRAKKIRTRAEVVREKARAVQKKASAA